MYEIIFKMPVCITMEFAGKNAANSDVWTLFATLLDAFAPSKTNLSSELGNVFIIFEICPKFDFNAGLFFNDFANYCDGWSDMTP